MKPKDITEKMVKEGDTFIKPDNKKVYVISKLVFDGGWAILKEKEGDGQYLTSLNSLNTWIKYEENG